MELLAVRSLRMGGVAGMPGLWGMVWGMFTDAAQECSIWKHGNAGKGHVRVSECACVCTCVCW